VKDLRPLSDILGELEAVLSAEHAALRVLDREAITRAAERKLFLDAELKEMSPESFRSPEVIRRLSRIKRAALTNQLLLVHARSCVQSVLSMVTGETFSPYPGTAPARMSRAPLVINVRG
jgi:hypothetical protein